MNSLFPPARSIPGKLESVDSDLPRNQPLPGGRRILALNLRKIAPFLQHLLRNATLSRYVVGGSAVSPERLSQPMNVAFIQFAPRFGEVRRNLDTAERLALEKAADADLIVLPELFSTGYLFLSRSEAFDLSEPFPGGPTGDSLARIASRLDAAVVGGMAERAGEKVYNSAALVRPDGSFEIYRKSHLFLDEKDYFDRSDGPIRAVDAAGSRIGMMICFDWYFPEVCRVLTVQGARVICHPANLVLPHAPEAMRTRSLENRVFTITANRSGADRRGGRELSFIGMSQVTAPDGTVLTRAPEEGEHVAVVEIDPRAAEDKRITAKNNLLEDRRPELYGDLL